MTEIHIPVPEIPQPKPTTAGAFRQIARTALDALKQYADGPRPVDTELTSWCFAIMQQIAWINQNDPLLAGTKPTASEQSES